MKKKYYIGLSLIVAIVILIIDQLTKKIITATMNIGDSYEVIPHFLNITSHRNNGAAWGILSGKMGFFYIITLIILAVLIIFYIKVNATTRLLKLELYKIITYFKRLIILGLAALVINLKVVNTTSIEFITRVY